MHSLLESYLSEVAANLASIPVKQRTEELREMRAHLENAIVVSREMGQTEDEAAQNAVAQFGTPQDLGENVVWAWRREQTLNKRSLWGAAVCSLAILLIAPFVIFPLEQHYFDPLHSTHLLTKEWLGWLLGYRFAGPILAGALTSLLFSKRAAFGGVYGPGLYFIFCIPASFHQLDNVALLCVQDGLVILLTAWIGSRWRMTWGKRRQRA